MTTKEEMFADATTVAEYGERLEALKAALGASVERKDAGRDGFVPGLGIIKGAGAAKSAHQGVEALSARVEELAKGLAEEDAAALRGELDALKGMTSDLAKDITVASPGNLHPYDLEAPAKVLVPRFTPLRNDMPRQPGKGTAREYRRILGWTNTGMGGVADMAPFFSSESDAGTPTFGSLALRRGQKISYAMDVKTANYVEMSVSSLVTYKAQFANMGFENTRALDQMALLWSHLLGEEKALLYARGPSGSGYTGPVSAPVLTSAVGAASGGSIGAGTYLVTVTARSGYGESVVSNEVSTGVLSGSTNKITVTVGTEPVGALGYNLYVTSGATGTEKFQTSFVGNSYVLTTYSGAGAAQPGADSTVNANAYDGFLTVLADPAQAGYVKHLNAALWDGTTGQGDGPYQDAFASLWASVYADPEEVWVTAPIRRELADYVKASAGGAAGYRLVIPDATFQNGTNLGGIVSGIVNESSPTSRIVDLRVHPYMPAGASFIRSRHLNIPDSGISDTSVVTAVQDYMSVDWPSIQFTYDQSTYWFGTAVHYAPKWSGSVLGIL